MRAGLALDFDTITVAYSTAIEAGSFADAQRVVHEALGAGASGAAIFARVLAPAMYRIGDRWERAEITAADEHLATAISNRVMGSVYEALAIDMPASKERVLIAAVQGDQHVMGLRMIADVLDGAGYETIYLGANTPMAEMPAAIAKHRPCVVALGGTAPWSAPRLIQTIHAIRAAEPTMPIVLGGAQAARAAKVAADPAVFLVPDAESVVEIVSIAVRSQMGF